jgi:preflagellin peptidase FlaK
LRRVVVLLDLARLLVGATLLAFASYTDWRWRRAPNLLWWIMAGAGAALLALEAALDWSGVAARWPYLVFAPLFAAAIYGFWWVGLIAGGADAKALMALALLVPFPLALADALPLLPAPVPGSFTILGDSLVVFLLIPLSLLAWNVAHGHARLPHALLGVKRKARDVRRGHAWPMEVVDADGRRRTKLFASRMSDAQIEETFQRVQALGEAKVWVTPKIPFMIPLLAGFLAAFFVGDLLFAGLRLLVPHPAP